MRNFVAGTLFILIVAACGGGGSDADADIGQETPQGTPEAQAAFESFLESPFISDSQADSTKRHGMERMRRVR